jgi:hypothetical protein
MEDIDYEVWQTYVNTEVAQLKELQDDSEFWKQLDEDFAMYDKNWKPS